MSDTIIEAKDAFVIDSSTGELFDIRVVPRSRPHHRGAFAVVFLDAMDRVFSSRTLKPIDKILFGKLITRLDFDNYISVVQKEIANEIGYASEEVSKSMRRLREAGIIYQGPRVGNIRTYRMAPTHAWRGTAKSRDVAMREHVEGHLTVHQGQANAFDDPLAPDPTPTRLVDIEGGLEDARERFRALKQARQASDEDIEPLEGQQHLYDENE